MKKTKILLGAVVLLGLMSNFANSQFDLPIPVIGSDDCDGCYEPEPEQILNNISTVTTGMDGTIPTLSVCGHDYNTDVDGCITMMDRNLGATSNDIEDISSYGEYYVRGNNYGFSRASSLNTGTDKIDCGNYSRQNPLNNNMFSITSSRDYCLSSNNDLWGGGLDTSGNNYDSQNPRFQRRGPCPVGYHVPSAGEWNALIDMWAGESVEGNLITSYISEFTNAFKIPLAGWLYRDGTFFNYGNYGHAYLWSSSPYQSNGWAYMIGIKDGMPINGVSSSYGDARANAVPIRCFKDVALKNKVSATVETGFKTTIGGVQYSGIPSTAVITTNTINKINGESVLGEVKVDFGTNENAIFSHLVEVNVPVDTAKQVIIKVKHAGSDEYNYDGLTTNANVSCDANGRPTSSQYNGETITVVDGFASIYTCAASSFIALDANGGNGLITVNIAALNNGQNTCTLDNYIFSGIIASPSAVFKNISQLMHCIFGDAGSKAVTLELSGNLTDGSGNIIPGGNVRLKNSAWIATPSGIQTGNTAIAEYTGLNQTITLFNKVANKIGEATGAGVDIQIEVPGGTPNGVYNGVLVLSY